jgi:nicotinamidase-related amidase
VSVLIVVDMQQVVARDTLWNLPGVRDLLPVIEKLADAFGDDVAYSRHVPARDGGRGTWKQFYENWRELDEDPSNWDLMPELAGRPGLHVSKSVYSVFGAPELRAELERDEPRELVLCGVETDCCVLATALEAIDHGVPVTVVEDAVASPSAAGHEGALALFRRLDDDQVKVTTAARLLAR